MGIKENSVCNFCLDNEDSNENMLIQCQIPKSLWTTVEEWIREIRVLEYELTKKNDKAHWLNKVILKTTKALFLSKLQYSTPTLYQVKLYKK